MRIPKAAAFSQCCPYSFSSFLLLLLYRIYYSKVWFGKLVANVEFEVDCRART